MMISSNEHFYQGGPTHTTTHNGSFTPNNSNNNNNLLNFEGGIDSTLFQQQQQKPQSYFSALARGGIQSALKSTNQFRTLSASPTNFETDVERKNGSSSQKIQKQKQPSNLHYQYQPEQQRSDYFNVKNEKQHQRKLDSLMQGTQLQALEEEVSREEDESMLLAGTDERRVYMDEANYVKHENHVGIKESANYTRNINMRPNNIPLIQTNYPGTKGVQNFTSSSIGSSECNYDMNLEEAQLFEMRKNSEKSFLEYNQLLNQSNDKANQILNQNKSQKTVQNYQNSNILAENNNILNITPNVSASQQQDNKTKNEILKNNKVNLQQQHQQLQQKQNPYDYNLQQKQKARRIIDQLKNQNPQQVQQENIQLSYEVNNNNSNVQANHLPVEQRLFEYQKKVDVKHEVQRLQKEKESMNELRPVPQISKHSNEIIMKKSMMTIQQSPDNTYNGGGSLSHNSSNFCIGTFNVDQKHYYEELQRKEELRQKIIEEKDMKDFTGRPEINKKSQQIKRDVNDLMDWKQKHDQKLESEKKRKQLEEQLELQKIQQVSMVNKTSLRMLDIKNNKGNNEKASERLYREASLRQKKQQKNREIQVAQQQNGRTSKRSTIGEQSHTKSTQNEKERKRSNSTLESHQINQGYQMMTNSDQNKDLQMLYQFRADSPLIQSQRINQMSHPTSLTNSNTQNTYNNYQSRFAPSGGIANKGSVINLNDCTPISNADSNIMRYGKIVFHNTQSPLTHEKYDQSHFQESVVSNTPNIPVNMNSNHSLASTVQSPIPSYPQYYSHQPTAQGNSNLNLNNQNVGIQQQQPPLYNSNQALNPLNDLSFPQNQNNAAPFINHFSQQNAYQQQRGQPMAHNQQQSFNMQPQNYEANQQLQNYVKSQTFNYQAPNQNQHQYSSNQPLQQQSNSNMTGQNAMLSSDYNGSTAFKAAQKKVTTQYQSLFSKLQQMNQSQATNNNSSRNSNQNNSQPEIQSSQYSQSSQNIPVISTINDLYNNGGQMITEITNGPFNSVLQSVISQQNMLNLQQNKSYQSSKNNQELQNRAQQMPLYINQGQIQPYIQQKQVPISQQLHQQIQPAPQNIHANIPANQQNNNLRNNDLKMQNNAHIEFQQKQNQQNAPISQRQSGIEPKLAGGHGRNHNSIGVMGGSSGPISQAFNLFNCDVNSARDSNKNQNQTQSLYQAIPSPLNQFHNTQNAIINKILDNSYIPTGNGKEVRRVAAWTSQDSDNNSNRLFATISEKSSSVVISPIRNRRDINKQQDNKDQVQYEITSVNNNILSGGSSQDMASQVRMFESEPDEHGESTYNIHNAMKSDNHSSAGGQRIKAPSANIKAQNTGNTTGKSNIQAFENQVQQQQKSKDQELNPNVERDQRQNKQIKEIGCNKNQTVFERNNKWMAEKQMRLEKAKEIQEMREERTCTFKPQTTQMVTTQYSRHNNRSKSIKSGTRNNTLSPTAAVNSYHNENTNRRTTSQQLSINTKEEGIQVQILTDTPKDQTRIQGSYIKTHQSSSSSPMPIIRPSSQQKKYTNQQNQLNSAELSIDANQTASRGGQMYSAHTQSKINEALELMRFENGLPQIITCQNNTNSGREDQNNLKVDIRVAAKFYTEQKRAEQSLGERRSSNGQKYVVADNIIDNQFELSSMIMEKSSTSLVARDDLQAAAGMIGIQITPNNYNLNQNTNNIGDHQRAQNEEPTLDMTDFESFLSVGGERELFSNNKEKRPLVGTVKTTSNIKLVNFQ